jgi:hypothetical protein
MFVPQSDITIGSFRFSGVKSVVITRSIHSLIETATITIPSVSRISKNGKVSSQTVITGKQFSEGDPVTIKIGYNGDLRTEFTGFVKSIGLNMPLEVVCEGYGWLLKRNTINKFYVNISLKDLLQDIVSGVDPTYTIAVQCNEDMTISNLAVNGSGISAVNKLLLSADNNLSCFFISPGVLWCGLAYSAYAFGNDVFNKGSINCRLGYNIPKENSLDIRSLSNDPVTVSYYKKQSDGTILTGTSNDRKSNARQYSRTLNNIATEDALERLAVERAYKQNYSGYEGRITTFLQPFAEPGYQAYVTDDRYPERNGDYIVEDTQTIFGLHGARRHLTLGPQTGFAK